MELRDQTLGNKTRTSLDYEGSNKNLDNYVYDSV